MSLDQLFDAAFDSADPRDAGAAMEAARAAFSEASGGPAWSYELALSDSQGEAFLLSHVLPRLTYFLHSRGTPAGAGVFISLFARGRLYFLAAPDFLGVLSEWSGLSLAEMGEKWGQGFA